MCVCVCCCLCVCVFVADIVFTFKFLMTPTNAALPPIRSWMQNDADLSWRFDVDKQMFEVSAFKQVNGHEMYSLHCSLFFLFLSFRSMYEILSFSFCSINQTGGHENYSLCFLSLSFFSFFAHHITSIIQTAMTYNTYHDLLSSFFRFGDRACGSACCIRLLVGDHACGSACLSTFFRFGDRAWGSACCIRLLVGDHACVSACCCPQLLVCAPPIDPEDEKRQREQEAKGVFARIWGLFSKDSRCGSVT